MSNAIEAVTFGLTPSPIDLLTLQIEQERLDAAQDKKNDAEFRKSLSDYQRALQRPAEDEKIKDDEARIAAINNSAT